MTAYVFALSGEPVARKAYHAYDDAIHVPAAAAIPGCHGGGDCLGHVIGPDGSRLSHRIGVLIFDDLEAARTAQATPEGQATAADRARLVTGGVTLAMVEIKEIPPA